MCTSEHEQRQVQAMMSHSHAIFDLELNCLHTIFQLQLSKGLN